MNHLRSEIGAGVVTRDCLVEKRIQSHQLLYCNGYICKHRLQGHRYPQSAVEHDCRGLGNAEWRSGSGGLPRSPGTSDARC